MEEMDIDGVNETAMSTGLSPDEDYQVAVIDPWVKVARPIPRSYATDLMTNLLEEMKKAHDAPLFKPFEGLDFYIRGDDEGANLVVKEYTRRKLFSYFALKEDSTMNKTHALQKCWEKHSEEGPSLQCIQKTHCFLCNESPCLWEQLNLKDLAFGSGLKKLIKKNKLEMGKGSKALDRVGTYYKEMRFVSYLDILKAVYGDIVEAPLPECVELRAKYWFSTCRDPTSIAKKDSKHVCRSPILVNRMENDENAANSKGKPTGPCATCGKTTSTRCGRCQGQYYCSRNCQKDDWKGHKSECLPAAGGVCSRCHETITASSSKVCRIPHPNHLQSTHRKSYGPTGQSESLACDACQHHYTKSSPSRDAMMSITEGPQWCYEGPHTFKPLKSTDNRRVYTDVVVLTPDDDDLQSQLDALDGNDQVRVLKIASSSYDSEGYTLVNIHMPNLVELQTHDINMEKMTLNTECTPKLSKLWMQNPTELDEPEYDIRCPTLKDVSFFYWGPGDSRWLQTLLDHAPCLESFDSYKLRADHLRFSSDRLRSIRLHRAEVLSCLELWAPNLVLLDLQAAYDMEEIYFLEQDPLKKKRKATTATGSSTLPCTEPLELNLENALLGPVARMALHSHPRIHPCEFNSYDDDGYGSGSLERILRHTR